MSEKIRKAFLKLGFKDLKKDNYGQLDFRVNENESISVDWSGTVYVFKGFNKYGKDYIPNCVQSFDANTKAKIEVLVKPLITK